MPYQIGDEEFATKGAITERCRQIMRASGHSVADEDVAFLLQLFQHHEQWAEKSKGGVEGVIVYQTPHGTPCFHLVCGDGRTEDISFPHAIKCVPTNKSASRLPQSLLDFKAAARETIKAQTRAFRDRELPRAGACPITGVILTATNAHVDHVAPLTFDRLLLDFTVENNVDPSLVHVGSRGGTVAFFTDEALAETWADFHQQRAELRMISQRGNLTLPKPRIDWGL